MIVCRHYIVPTLTSTAAISQHRRMWWGQGAARKFHCNISHGDRGNFQKNVVQTIQPASGSILCKSVHIWKVVYPENVLPGALQNSMKSGCFRTLRRHFRLKKLQNIMKSGAPWKRTARRLSNTIDFLVAGFLFLETNLTLDIKGFFV